MKKEILYLLVIALIGILLSACQSQATPEVAEVVPTNTINPVREEPTVTPTLEPTATNTPEATSTATTEPTATIPPTETIEPTATEPPAPGVGSERTWETDQMQQVYVPAGDVILGSTDIEAKVTLEGGRAYPEIPVNTVYLDSYWIDKYEVTTGQYALCVDAGVCTAPYRDDSETRPSYYNKPGYYGNPEYADYPVIWVSWYMASEYCEWAGRRLPTEAEWEKASRGTEGAKYPWGNDPVSGERANFCDVNCGRTIANGNFDDGYGDTAPVGSYPAGASPYGAMDMSGNVWEWTSTLIQDYPYDATDGRENQDVWGERVWRGGTWSNGYWWIRSSVRYRSVPTYWYVNLGFRCASSQ